MSSIIRKINTVLITVFLLFCLSVDVMVIRRDGFIFDPFSGKIPITSILLILILGMRLLLGWIDRTQTTAVNIQQLVDREQLPALSPDKFKDCFRRLHELRPDWPWKEQDQTIEIAPLSGSGFSVTIEFSSGLGIEYTIYYASDHCHFPVGQEADALGTFLLGLSDVVRMKVFSKEDKDYRFTTEIRGRQEQSFSLMNTTLYFTPVALKFWLPRKTRYLQNHYLTSSDMKLLFGQLVLEAQNSP